MPVLHMLQTSRGAHAPGRASTHARALELLQIMIDNTARVEIPRLPELARPRPCQAARSCQARNPEFESKVAN
ncbi:hypothetical protein JCGZ_14943 [Jatropha curcas]|uniref:Uncharacterized protein n=1 Tax=Jatropha curcas TaxID=180498 RepID=A0A067KIW2_JATCU|nr:hypothetical protein JCGZ_14943 [Jatropha curcas]